MSSKRAERRLRGKENALERKADTWYEARVRDCFIVENFNVNLAYIRVGDFQFSHEQIMNTSGKWPLAVYKLYHAAVNKQQEC